MRDEAALRLVRGISPETSVDDLFLYKLSFPFLYTYFQVKNQAMEL
jgi:hypothetical protein